MNNLYTLGYSTKGFTPELVQEIVTELDAVLVDVRYSTKSKKKLQWSGAELSAKLGDNYQHIQELGNTNYFNYEDSTIIIADIQTGLQKLLPILDKQNVITFCTCTTYARCHRSVITEHLNNAGYELQAETITPATWRKRPAITAPLFAGVANAF